VKNFQASKSLVLNFYHDLDGASGNEIDRVLERYTNLDYHWRGMHPFDIQHGTSAVAEQFWKPFRNAFTAVQRRQDVFMAGLNDVDGNETEWVCSMGHLMGLFDHEWLGIPPTRKLAFLRYAEFNRITEGKISETAFFCDILSVMQQAGLHPLPPQTGAFFITPGPRTHDGLMLYADQDPAESIENVKSD
jgi:hypothetical protein